MTEEKFDIASMYPEPPYDSFQIYNQENKTKTKTKTIRKPPKRRFSTPEVSCLIRAKALVQENHHRTWYKHTDDIPHLFKIGRLTTVDDLTKVPFGLDGAVDALCWKPKLRKFPMLHYRQYNPRGYYIYKPFSTLARLRQQEFTRLMYERRWAVRQEEERQRWRRIERESKERQAQLEELIATQKAVLRVKYIELVREAKTEAKIWHSSALRKGQSLKEAEWILTDLAKKISALEDQAREELKVENERVKNEFWSRTTI